MPIEAYNVYANAEGTECVSYAEILDAFMTGRRIIVVDNKTNNGYLSVVNSVKYNGSLVICNENGYVVATEPVSTN